MTGRDYDSASLKAQSEKLRAEADKVWLEFMKAEPELGFTFLGLAKTRLDNEHKEAAAGCLTHAEEAHSALAQFLSFPNHADIADEQRRQLEDGMARLRVALDGFKQAAG